MSTEAMPRRKTHGPSCGQKFTLHVFTPHSRVCHYLTSARARMTCADPYWRIKTSQVSSTRSRQILEAEGNTSSENTAVQLSILYFDRHGDILDSISQDYTLFDSSHPTVICSIRWNGNKEQEMLDYQQKSLAIICLDMQTHLLVRGS